MEWLKRIRQINLMLVFDFQLEIVLDQEFFYNFKLINEMLMIESRSDIIDGIFYSELFFYDLEIVDNFQG